MKATLLTLFFASLFYVSTASKVADLMVVCYTKADKDVCNTGQKRRLLLKQGEEQQHRRQLLQCGEFCSDWSEFCAEFMCNMDTMGRTCDELTAEARVELKAHADDVGSDECKKQMDDDHLQCMCINQADIE